MQTADERRKLVEHYDETRDLVMVLVTCVAGLLLVIGLVTMAALPGGEAWREPGSTQDVRTAVGHRKQVFDERRTRYLGREAAQSLAEGWQEGSNNEHPMPLLH